MPTCPDCNDHHWVVWKDEKGMPVAENCQKCNPDQEDPSKLKDAPAMPKRS